ncbi:unnamed protein product [Boreogadus saida]
MEELPVEVAGSICCWGLHSNVAAIYGPHCHIEGLGTSRCRKAIPHFLQVLGMSDYPPENGHNSLACPVYHVKDCGPWDVESPRHHWIRCSMGKPIEEYQHVYLYWPTMVRVRPQNCNKGCDGLPRQAEISLEHMLINLTIGCGICTLSL